MNLVAAIGRSPCDHCSDNTLVELQESMANRALMQVLFPVWAPVGVTIGQLTLYSYTYSVCLSGRNTQFLIN